MSAYEINFTRLTLDAIDADPRYANLAIAGAIVARIIVELIDNDWQVRQSAVRCLCYALQRSGLAPQDVAGRQGGGRAVACVASVTPLSPLDAFPLASDPLDSEWKLTAEHARRLIMDAGYKRGEL